MPLEASHIRFALDSKDRLGVKDIKKYISGTIYPDSRYVTETDRELTHPQDFLESSFFMHDDFRKGWYTHILYDKIKRDYTDEHLPEIVEDMVESSGQRSELWIRLTALKILQDMRDTKEYDITQYLPYLDYIENPNGEDIAKLVEYNTYFQKMYANPQHVSFSSYYEMWKFLGMGEDLVAKVKLHTEQYANDIRITKFIKTVYSQTLLLVR